MVKVCIVTGARPNFMKAAPIIRAINKAIEEGKQISYRLIYTGLHDDSTLEPSLFTDLEINKPDAFLNADCENLNELAGKTMFAFEQELTANPTDVVIVVDDLTSTMACAIVAKKKGVMLAHLVAGTRSFDIKMPKEINRLVIDGLSDLLFTAGVGSNRNVSREGAETSQVYMVGNILVDTLRFNRNKLVMPAIFNILGLKEKEYLVFTLNRHALLSNPENLKKMLAGFIREAGNTPIIAPMHEYAGKEISQLLPAGCNFHIVPPQTYLGFGYLTTHAKGIITDSGNVAEEATFNGVPCITLNSYTEHTETVTVGTNVLVGEDSEKLAEATHNLISGTWKQGALPERWDGRTAERIIQILLEYNEDK